MLEKKDFETVLKIVFKEPGGYFRLRIID